MILTCSITGGPRSLGQEVPGFTLRERIIVPLNGSTVASTSALALGVTYKLKASGTFHLGGPGDGLGDAEYGDFSNPPTSLIDGCMDGTGIDLAIGINDGTIDSETLPDWGPYDPSHVYIVSFVGTGFPISVNYHDCFYADNSGSLTVEVFEPCETATTGALSIDCQPNGIPDDCDTYLATSEDCQPNAIPDECEVPVVNLLTEGFASINALTTAGWVRINRSAPVGTTAWFQGNTSVFFAQSGVSNSYIAANYQNCGIHGTISNWLLTPQMELTESTTLTFYTRGIIGSTFPDRLEVRASLSGSSADVGSTATSVGDFTRLLLTINPNLEQGGYPQAWTQYQIPLDGIGSPVNGRLAFRYFVTNAGPDDPNSDYIGIDTVNVSRSQDCNVNAVPDACDLSGGSSTDVNANGIPDECENIQQIPAMSQWGFACMICLMLCAGTIVLRRASPNTAHGVTA